MEAQRAARVSDRIGARPNVLGPRAERAPRRGGEIAHGGRCAACEVAVVIAGRPDR